MDPGSSSSVFYDGFVPMNEDQRDDGFCNGLADDVPYYDADIGADDVPDQGDGECVDMDDNKNDEVIYTPECTEDMKPYKGQIFPTLDDAKEFYNNYALCNEDAAMWQPLEIERFGRCHVATN
ncbi:protein FAR1-RELATED SEQUENCE 5-like [Salvia divinorum]|uniref:Protein FAR1-RELATED SEQUENCE 5-like n=1 Tax=Salvia divinorum TaxID=28513 RepID=A0ABD1FZH7_SALDI